MAVYACPIPAVIDAVAGRRSRWSADLAGTMRGLSKVQRISTGLSGMSAIRVRDRPDPNASKSCGVADTGPTRDVLKGAIVTRLSRISAGRAPAPRPLGGHRCLTGHLRHQGVQTCSAGAPRPIQTPVASRSGAFWILAAAASFVCVICPAALRTCYLKLQAKPDRCKPGFAVDVAQ